MLLMNESPLFLMTRVGCFKTVYIFRTAPTKKINTNQNRRTPDARSVILLWHRGRNEGPKQINHNQISSHLADTSIICLGRWSIQFLQLTGVRDLLAVCPGLTAPADLGNPFVTTGVNTVICFVFNGAPPSYLMS